MKKILLVLLFLIGTLNSKPKLTVVIVIDQFAANYLKKLDPYLSHGIHRLVKNGIVYTNAHLPHGVTSTAVGHASLGTGSLPKDHGIVSNGWYDTQNKFVKISDDKAAKYLAIPTLNVPFRNQNPNNKTFAASLKGHAATGMAGKKTPMVWLNEDTLVAKNETSEISSLLKKFNNSPILKQHQTSWKPAYNDDAYYSFPEINNYKYTRSKSFFDAHAHEGTGQSRVKFLNVLNKLPETNKLLLDLAEEYIKKQYPTLNDGSMLVWVSLSSLDKIGHIFGPQSKEAIDTVYHIDKYLGSFMDNIAKIVPPSQTLYALTADHGVMPIPELVQKQHPQAGRITPASIINRTNKIIYNEFKIDTIVTGYKKSFLYLDKNQLKKLSPFTKNELLNRIIAIIKNIPGIKNVYTAEKIKKMKAPIGNAEWFFKNNLFSNRSGDLIIIPEPYFLITSRSAGTGHQAPYPYNTHVPLILHQPQHHENETVTKRVWMPQITRTLAQILKIPPSSEYMLKALPATQNL